MMLESCCHNFRIVSCIDYAFDINLEITLSYIDYAFI